MSRRVVLFVIMIFLFQSNLMRKEVFGMTTLKPSVALSERYQSNVDGSGTDEDASEDYETSISPQISLLNEWESLSVNGDYTLNSRFYSKDSDRNYIGHSFRLVMEKHVTKNMSLSISDTYLYTNDSREALEDQMEIGRDTVITNTADLYISYTFSERFFSNIGISQRTTLYDDVRLFDDRSDSFSLSLSDRLSRFLTFNLSYGYTVFRYEDGEDIDDRESHNVSLGLTRMLARALSFTLTVGANYMPEMESDYDWTGTAEIYKSWRITSLHINYSRAVTNSGGLTANILINNHGSLGLTIYSSRRTSLTLSGTYSRNKSKDSDEIDSYSYSYGISSSWSPSELTSVTLGMTRFEQKTEDLITREVENNTVFLSVAITPEGWRF